MKKMLVIAPTPSDATSFWRAFGPWSQLRVPGVQIDFNYLEQVDWSVSCPYDIIFAQRFFTREHQNVIEYAKSMGKRIWLDYDDLLTELPLSNPAAATYNNAENKNALLNLFRLADVLTVSTDELREELQKLTHAPVKTVTNAWPDHLLPFTPKEFKKHKRIFWRGGPTHFQDLWDVKDDLHDLVKQLPDHQFIFVGAVPYFIPDIIPKEQFGCVEGLGIVKYYNVLKVMEAELCIVPLHDSKFNRCKSSIGWLEATFAGAAVVAPEFKEWQNMAISRYKPGVPGSFRDKVLDTLENAESRYNMSCKLMKSAFMVSDVNKQRAEILLAL